VLFKNVIVTAPPPDYQLGTLPFQLRFNARSEWRVVMRPAPNQHMNIREHGEPPQQQEQEQLAGVFLMPSVPLRRRALPAPPEALPARPSTPVPQQQKQQHPQQQQGPTRSTTVPGQQQQQAPTYSPTGAEQQQQQQQQTIDSTEQGQKRRRGTPTPGIIAAESSAKRVRICVEPPPQAMERFRAGSPYIFKNNLNKSKKNRSSYNQWHRFIKIQKAK
jgi:hypothetical protein